MAADEKGFTEKVADFIAKTDAKVIPAGSYGQAGVAFLDWMACALAGMVIPFLGTEKTAQLRQAIEALAEADNLESIIAMSAVH